MTLLQTAHKQPAAATRFQLYEALRLPSILLHDTNSARLLLSASILGNDKKRFILAHKEVTARNHRVALRLVIDFYSRMKCEGQLPMNLSSGEGSVR